MLTEGCTVCLPSSCQKTVMQHHEHAKQRLREELQAQMAAQINQQVAAHTEETEQLRSVAELQRFIIWIKVRLQSLFVLKV